MPHSVLYLWVSSLSQKCSQQFQHQGKAYFLLRLDANAWIMSLSPGYGQWAILSILRHIPVAEGYSRYYNPGMILAPSWSSLETLAELTSNLPLLTKACTIASATRSPSDAEPTTATHVGPAPLMVHPKAPVGKMQFLEGQIQLQILRSSRSYPTLWKLGWEAQVRRL